MSPSNTAGPRTSWIGCPALAADLVRRRVALIAAASPPAAFAAKAASSRIPIVFAMAQDPVRLGLVASLARPGGNLTGVNFLATELAAKRLELLRELVPSATRVAAIVTPSNEAVTISDVEAAARTIGLQIQFFSVKQRSRYRFGLREPCANTAGCSVRQQRHFPNRAALSIDPMDSAPGHPCDLLQSQLSRDWRADELRHQRGRCLPPGRRLRRPHPQGRRSPPTCRWCNRRSSSWSSTRRLPGPRHHGAIVAAHRRRRGDRVALVDESHPAHAHRRSVRPRLRRYADAAPAGRRGAGQGRHHRRQPAGAAGPARHLQVDAAAAHHSGHRDGGDRRRARRRRNGLSTRAKGLCQRARAAAARRLLRRIHRGARACAAPPAAARRSRSGGVPLQLSGRLASAAHRDARRPRQDGADRCRRPADWAAPRYSSPSLPE